MRGELQRSYCLLTLTLAQVFTGYHSFRLTRRFSDPASICLPHVDA